MLTTVGSTWSAIEVKASSRACSRARCSWVAAEFPCAVALCTRNPWEASEAPSITHSRIKTRLLNRTKAHALRDLLNIAILSIRYWPAAGDPKDLSPNHGPRLL